MKGDRILEGLSLRVKKLRQNNDMILILQDQYLT